jgi:N-methylhydantoinase A
VDSIPLVFPGNVDANLNETLAKMFTDAHNVAFGYTGRGTLEVVSLRLRAIAPASRMTFSTLEKTSLANGGQPARQPMLRKAYFGPAQGIREAAVLARSDVASFQAGPLIIEEPDTTVVVPPDWMVRRAEYGNLFLEKAN